MKLSVLTTGRQDWTYLRPLVRELGGRTAFELCVYAGGMACSSSFGSTVDTVEREDWPGVVSLAWPVDGESPSNQAAHSVSYVGRQLEADRPDAIILLGDRYETAGAALAATILRTRIVHLYGGEETEGAFDNSLRNAITKLSHLHFVSHALYGARICGMGEDPTTVHTVGALSIDAMRELTLPSQVELEEDLGVSLASPVGLVTMHPATLSEDLGVAELEAVLTAMERFHATWIITLPNVDPGGAEMRRRIAAWAEGRARVRVIPALGHRRYFGVMKLAAFVLGNSSSGIIEAPAMGTPTINVGDRQRGRVRCSSVVDVPGDADHILSALKSVAGEGGGRAVVGAASPFGNGHAAASIATVLEAWRPVGPPRKPSWTGWGGESDSTRR